jgi:hypothetical protein
MLKNIMSDVGNTVKQYEDKFSELKSAFQGRAIISSTEITLYSGSSRKHRYASGLV